MQGDLLVIDQENRLCVAYGIPTNVAASVSEQMIIVICSLTLAATFRVPIPALPSTEIRLFCAAKPATQSRRVTPEANRKIFSIAFVILLLDQLTKWIVVRTLRYGDEYVVIDGFFRFVHWGNTGAAWSLFRDNNHALLIVAIVAVIVLFLLRRHFGAELKLGQIALGCMFGGIIGNIIDRIRFDHVVDFIYFYVNRRSGAEIGFPAFNVADSGICIGVGLLFILSWQLDSDSGEVQPELAAESSESDSEPPAK